MRRRMGLKKALKTALETTTMKTTVLKITALKTMVLEKKNCLVGASMATVRSWYLLARQRPTTVMRTMTATTAATTTMTTTMTTTKMMKTTIPTWMSLTEPPPLLTPSLPVLHSQLAAEARLKSRLRTFPSSSPGPTASPSRPHSRPLLMWRKTQLWTV
jgi:hypothetical protein